MKEIAQNGYTAAEILRALRMADGSREISFEYELLDKYDRRIGNLENITCSVSYASLTQIKGTASFDLAGKHQPEIDFLNDRIKPYFILKMPDGGQCKWPLGIFLLSSPDKDYKARRITAYDKTLILAQDKTQKRLVIPQGSNYINAVINLIGNAGIPQVDIPANEATLAYDKEFDINVSYANIVNELLSAVNYTSLYFDENGVAKAKPYTPPSQRTVELDYTDGEYSIMFEDATETEDYYEVPNVFVVTASNPDMAQPLSSVYINSKPENKLSTVSRGRRIVAHYELSDTASQAALDAYAIRMAYEASQIYSKISFSTALMPIHGYSDTLYISHPVLALPGVFSETRWEMELKPGGRMKHEARRLVFV